MKATLLLLLVSLPGFAQISFFNMPNPDMLPDVGYSYVEFDRYQTVKSNNTVNASVFRASFQVTQYLEAGTNWWFNEDNPSDPNRVVLATKWKVNVFNSGTFTMTFHPGSWTSLYFDGETPMKNIVYGFMGLNHVEGPQSYTRLMLGGYGKFIKDVRSTYGLIGGFEHRFNDHIEFVVDYFQGSGEGFGLAAGVVYYAAEKGHNLPLYLAYQWDNDSRENDLILFQIGYFFRAWGQKS